MLFGDGYYNCIDIKNFLPDVANIIKIFLSPFAVNDVSSMLAWIQ
ncbi:MAG: hypothetical protein FKGGLIKP_00549 [Sodalis sp. Fse]|nr:MAG: hypothetical protein FKGGLIKP_00549 [Sodalis sp. Fse]